MREVERIDRILKLIGDKWKKSPDWRFYQLLINIGLIRDDFQLWNTQDDMVELWLNGNKEELK